MAYPSKPAAMKSRHDKTKQPEDSAAANQNARGAASKPAVQAQTGTEETGQLKTVETAGVEAAQLQNASRRAVPAIKAYTEPKRSPENHHQAEALDTPKGPGYNNPLQTQLKPIAQLLGSKGKAKGLADAAKRCDFDAKDPVLIRCWNDAPSLEEFERLTADSAAFTEYEKKIGEAAPPPPPPPVFVAPDEAAQRARFFVEAAKVNWKAGNPLAPAHFAASEVRDALPEVVKILKHDFHHANGGNTTQIRQEKNAAVGVLDALFETVKQRLLHREAEALRDAGFAIAKQAMLALPAVQGNAIVLHVVTNLQRSGNMVTAVVPGEYTGAEISAAIAVWVALAPLPALINNLNVPGGHNTISLKLRAGVREYNKNLICSVDNNPNNFHITPNRGLRDQMDAAGPNVNVAL